MTSIIANEMGIQVFISSHSYFVIKGLYLLAQETKSPITCVSLEDSEYTISNMLEGMPSNSIMDESIRLYEREIEEVL